MKTIIYDYNKKVSVKDMMTIMTFCDGFVPRQNDCIVVDGKKYYVESTTIDYDNDEIYIFVR